MANVKALTWPAYYARNRDDEGAIQNLFQTHLGTLAAKSKSHLQNTGKFTESITGSAHGNMILIPGTTGKMQLIHQWFSCSTDDGFALVFVQRNLSDYSYFRILDRNEAVKAIKVIHGRRVTTTNCPTLVSMLSVSSTAEFKDLPAQGNGILSERPNHLMVNGDVFLMAEGAPEPSPSQSSTSSGSTWREKTRTTKTPLKRNRNWP